MSSNVVSRKLYEFTNDNRKPIEAVADELKKKTGLEGIAIFKTELGVYKLLAKFSKAVRIDLDAKPFDEVECDVVRSFKSRFEECKSTHETVLCTIAETESITEPSATSEPQPITPTVAEKTVSLADISRKLDRIIALLEKLQK